MRRDQIYRVVVVGSCWCLSLLIIMAINYGSSFEGGSWSIEGSCEMRRLLGPLEGDDPKVLDHVRERYMLPPATLPYNLTDSTASGFQGFSWPFIHHYITFFFQDQPKGFFMEAGALDGEFLSNTLWLERQMRWSGLLLEPDEDNFMHLVWKRRKAWASNTCLSTTGYPKEILFGTPQQQKGGLSYPWLYRANGFEISKQLARGFDFFGLARSVSYKSIQCFPLATYLLILNVTSLDFLSLDTQGGEWQILKTVLEVNKTRVRSFVVEHYHKGVRFSVDHLFVRYMMDVGYHLVDCDEEPNYFFVLKTDKILMDKVKLHKQKGLKTHCNVTFT